jgi:hypothetical protein
MAISEVLGVRLIRPRASWILSVLVASAVLFGMSSASPVSNAKAVGFASNFCGGWLDPAWTGTYRCDSPDSLSGYHRQNVMINTRERAGCVDYADVWHNLIDSWTCYPKWTELGGIKVRQDGGWYRGVIRNNNLSYKGQFIGTITWEE